MKEVHPMRNRLASLIIITLALSAGCEQPKSNGSLSVKKTDEQPVNDIGIATFSTPDGWVSNRSNGNTAAILTRKGSDPAALEEMISIDIGKPMSDDVKNSAEGVAQKFGGKISELSFDVDGMEAYRISIPPNYETLMPRECIVVHHDGKACILFAGSKAQSDIWATVEAVAKSWVWK